VIRLFHRLIAALALTACWLASAPEASACAACFGKSNDAMFTGYIVGAMVLIGFVCSVFVGIIAFGIHMNRRAKSAAMPAGDEPGSPDLFPTSK